MAALLQVACEAAGALAEAIEAPYVFKPSLMRHRDDRSSSQHDFRIAVEYPTGARLPIKFELTQVEPIVFPVEARPVVHEFADESFDLSMPVYDLNEVVVEKLRAFLQSAVNLDLRDWTNRARDLYDLWWLHENHAPVAWAELRGPLGVKAAARGVAFTGPADFLDPRVLRSYRDSWNIRLANVVPNLPPFDEALTAVTAILGQVFATEPPRVSLR